jgi:hypothetical protein
MDTPEKLDINYTETKDTTTGIKHPWKLLQFINTRRNGNESDVDRSSVVKSCGK